MRTLIDAPEIRSDKKDLPPKNRVWGFREPARSRIRKSASQLSKSRRENRPTPTTIVLGRWFYLQPDPIGFEGGMNLYVYAEDNPLRLIDEFGQSAADVQKIFSTFRFSVDLMTQKGLRHRNGLWGNAQRLLYDKTGGFLGHYYYLCHEQTDYVIMFLESKSYDDQWIFVRQYRTFPPHVWGKAISSNPCDPDVKFDPWKDEIVTIAK